jgi:hypothetical protein
MFLLSYLETSLTPDFVKEGHWGQSYVEQLLEASLYGKQSHCVCTNLPQWLL